MIIIHFVQASTLLMFLNKLKSFLAPKTIPQIDGDKQNPL